MLDYNEILSITGTDYQNMTLLLLKEADLAGQIRDRRARIALKPNLVSPSPPSYGATTHTQIVAGIIIYLQERGFGDIRIMESSWVGARTKDSMEIAGYDRLCREYGVPFMDMQKEKSFTQDCAGMELSLCSAVKDIDFLINIPVLKGHCQTRMTCCLKNMKGLIPSKEKRRFHSLGLHKPIAHLAAAIRQDFIVVDNICGDPDFEDGGNPLVRNRIYVGRDPVLLDTYGCRLLDLDPEDVGYLKMAAGLGAGSMDLRHARIRSLDEAEEEKGGSVLHKIVALEDAVEEVESCSACYGSLLPVLERMREEWEEQGRPWDLPAALGGRICIGQGWQGKTGRIGIGRCTRLFDHHVDGCPPKPEEIYDFLNGLTRTR